MRTTLAGGIASFTLSLLLLAVTGISRAESILQFEYPQTYAGDGVEEDGYIFSSPIHEGFVNGGGFSFRDPPPGSNNYNGLYTVPYDGTSYIVPFTSSEPVLSRADGLSFTLQSFDYAPYSASPYTNYVAVTGYYAGGGIINTQLVWSGVVQGLPGDFHTFGFNNGWTNLNQVVMFASFLWVSYVGFSIDNIAVPTILEPGTLTLVCLSLLSLALTLRSRWCVLGAASK